MTRWLLVVLVACACPSKPTASGPGSGSGSGSAVPVANGCEAAKPQVELLYKGEGLRDDLVADNVAMVMKDCRKKPELAACALNATSVAQLEKQCPIPLDPEGSEGLELKK